MFKILTTTLVITSLLPFGMAMAGQPITQYKGGPVQSKPINPCMPIQCALVGTLKPGDINTLNPQPLPPKVGVQVYR